MSRLLARHYPKPEPPKVEKVAEKPKRVRKSKTVEK